MYICTYNYVYGAMRKKVMHQTLGAGILSGMWDFPLWYVILNRKVTSDPFFSNF